MQEAEDMDHLFINCKFSGGVWDKVKSRAKIHIHQSTWDDTVQEFGNDDMGNNIRSVIMRLCFAACVYSIRYERNCRIFRDEKKEPNDVAKSILENVKLKLMSLKVKNSVAVRIVEKEWGIVCKKS
ncbi:reverse transcriptase domain, Reverse transcriptase zinc-binding domain protein [Artemisia annua]|uniref:Reverse transcriptase domain, Reverse transcriptase zinc-binding domain protein n=1 Tax=Artemisia annua TaxID=35608 RepID=A0A2U1LNS0_ARTAN|nr:reverse transcriptase domain, Reverse transcriptase zinc-binding domain protein [Artemisia annua]